MSTFYCASISSEETKTIVFYQPQVLQPSNIHHHISQKQQVRIVSPCTICAGGNVCDPNIARQFSMIQSNNARYAKR